MSDFDYTNKNSVWAVMEHIQDQVQFVSGNTVCVGLFADFDDAYKCSKKRAIANAKEYNFEFNQSEDYLGSFYYENNDRHFYYEVWIEQQTVHGLDKKLKE